MEAQKYLALILVFFYLCIESINGQDLLSSGATISLGDVSYYISDEPFASGYQSIYTASAGSSKVAFGLLPVTVLDLGPALFSLDTLEQNVVAFEKKDDVWTTAFLAVVILQGTSPTNSNISLTATTIGNTTVNLIKALSSPKAVPQGPYFLSPTGNLHQPYRLYADTEGAFTQPIVPYDVGRGIYAALPGTVPGINAPGVAVPSRLSYTKTATKPLAGVRIGIKDIYDIAGLRTSDGNRAFYELYPPRNATAEPVQRLINAGAILVGKMKTSQFANGELATADWVDYHEPFNPRGDGYQDTSSSSAGAGSGIGSYSWLDVALGSDTGGSIRGPSIVQGVYGNRPSHGLVPLTNTMSLAPQLDTAGFLYRDPKVGTTAAKVLYEDAIHFFPRFPPILRTLNFPVPGQVAPETTVAQTNAILLTFLSKVEAFLGLKSTPLNYTSLWDQTKPNPALPPLSILLNRTYPTLISKEQTKNERDPFFADYAAVHDGRRPFVDPVPRARWAFGDSLPASELDVANANKTLFQNFWETHVLPAGNNDSAYCSESLVLYSAGVNIQYRDTYLAPPVPPFGFDDSQISIFAEVPDFVVPLGSASYNSTITNHTEVLPVSVDIIAARGCDGVIFSLVEGLLDAGIVAVSQAGRTITGGDILYKA